MSAVRPLPVQRDLFDVPPEVAYFNVASLSPTLRSAVAAGQQAIQTRAQPWQVTGADWFEGAELRRDLFARVINASANGVALVPATSYGFAVAAANLAVGPGRRILVLADEYPSGVYTWRALAARTGCELLTVRREPGQSWTEAVLSACDERVAVLSVPQVHWTDGSILDLAAVARRRTEIGAALVIDGSQSVGAVPLDVAALDPDFLVTVGYKWLLGPFGLAYLYVADRHREGRPLEENWIARSGSENFSRLVDYQEEYQPGARRFDMGARTAFELTPMAVAALEQILAWGVGDIAVSLRVLTDRLADAARVRGLDIPAERGPHMLGVRLPAGTVEPVARALSAAQVFVGPRGSALRLSPHLHTTDDDVDRLFTALDRAVRELAPTSEPSPS
jgi:selenocysteine lyase/cysteine desulfurase